MTESMVERVARAMAENEIYDEWEGLSDDPYAWPNSKPLWRRRARAAIAAMRTPTEEMMDACYDGDPPRTVWRLMIDQALADQDTAGGGGTTTTTG